MLLCIKLLVGPVLLLLVFSRLPVTNVVQVLREARLSQCIAGYALLFMVSALQGVQISLAMPHRPGSLTTPRLIRLHFISCFYAVLVPTAVTQSLVKWHRLARGAKLRAESAAVVIYLRVLNIAAMMVLAVLGFLFDKQASEGHSWHISILLLAASLLVMAPVLSHRLSLKAASATSRLARPIPVPKFAREGVSRVWRAILDLNRMSYSRRMAAFLTGVAYLLLVALAFSQLANSVGADVHIAAMLWLQFLLFFVTILPVSVLGLGVREATLVSLLPRLYDTEPTSALAASFLISGWHIMVLLAGGVCEAYETARPQKED